MSGGVAILGRVMHGTIRAQTRAELVGFDAPIAVTVAALDQGGGAVAEVVAGQDAAVLLMGIEYNVIRKGHVLAAPGAFTATKVWVVDFKLALDHDNPERNMPTYAPYPIELASGIKGTFRLPKEGDLLVYDQAMRGTLELDAPLVLFTGIASTIMWGGAIVGELSIVGPAPMP